MAMADCTRPLVTRRLLSFVGLVLCTGCISPPLFDDDNGGGELDANVTDDVTDVDGGTDAVSDETDATETGTEVETDVAPTDTEQTDETPSGGTDASVADGGMPPEGVGLVSTFPEHEAVDVDPDVQVVLEFDRPVEPGAGVISLLEGLNEVVVDLADVDDEMRVQFDDATVIIDWAITLASFASYSVVVEQGAIVGQDGQSFDGISVAGEFSFATGDPGVLTLDGTFPSNGDVDVELDTDISLVFSEDVQPGGAGALSVVESEEGTVVQTVLLGDANLVDIDGPLVTVDLPTDLAYGLSYYVVIEPDAIVSLKGARFAGFDDPEVLSFSTVTPPELALLSMSPMDDATGVDPDTALVFTFSDDVVAGSGAVRVYLADDDSLAVSVEVTEPEVQFTADTMTVQLPLSLAPASSYYVIIDAGAVASDAGGVYAGLLDTTAMSFTTAETPLAPLLVDSTTPLAGAVDVPVDTELAIEFSQDVRLGSGNISIYADGAVDAFEVVAATSDQVTLSGATVTIDLGRTLSGNTTYHVLITAGTFESVAGASFMGISDPAVFSFTTENIFGLSSRSPADGATGVEPGTDLVLTFSEDVELGAGAIEVRASSDGELLEEVRVGDGRIAADGAVVTVDLDRLLDGTTDYYVVVDDGVVLQASGTEVYAGTTSATDWNFTTAAVDYPGAVTAGLVLWVDASYDASLKTVPGISVWADRSGQNNDLTQGGGGRRPQRVTDGIGGLPVARFDGDDDWLVAPRGFDFTAVEGFIVWQSPAAFSTTQKRSLLINGANLEVNHGHPTGAQHSVAACVGSPCNDSTTFEARFAPAPVADEPYLWNFGFDSVTTSLFTGVDGGATNFQSAPTTNPVAADFALALGGSSDACADTGGCYFDGDIGEVLLFSRRLNQAERLAITEYLRDKWSLDQPVCDPDEMRGANGSCYYLNSAATNWWAARDACANRGEGWSLATVRSALDDAVIIGILGSSVNDAFIGASDVEVPNTWRWINDTLHFWSGGGADDGSGMAANGAYTNWRFTEPSQGSTEACARYNFFEGSWTWADGSCDDAYPYICAGPGN